MYCRNCGEKIPENSNFCFNCGVTVDLDRKGASEPTVTTEKPIELEQEKESKGCGWWPWVIIIAIFSFIMMVILSPNESTEVPTVTSSAPALKNSNPELNSQPNNSRAESLTENERKAKFNAERSATIYYAKEIVKEQLAYPKTAKFGWNNNYGADQKYRSVTNTVTCKNAFGVESEYEYVVILILKDNPDEGYFPISLMIDGEIYYDYRELINEHGEFTDAAVE